MRLIGLNFNEVVDLSKSTLVVVPMLQPKDGKHIGVVWCDKVTKNRDRFSVKVVPYNNVVIDINGKRTFKSFYEIIDAVKSSNHSIYLLNKGELEAFYKSMAGGV